MTLFLSFQGAGSKGANQVMKTPPELFDLFMTYSFDLQTEVEAENIIINHKSRTMSTKKKGQQKKKRTAISDSDIDLASDSEPAKVVKKRKGAGGEAVTEKSGEPKPVRMSVAEKEAVADKKKMAPRKDEAAGTMTITSFFSRKPPGIVGAPAPDQPEEDDCF
jgi:hypothetical protein